jgi:hypothetical protein
MKRYPYMICNHCIMNNKGNIVGLWIHNTEGKPYKEITKEVIKQFIIRWTYGL